MRQTDYDDLAALIVERRNTFPKRLAQVAAHALANPDDIAFGTVASIAASADVQPSALIRFAQSLGFEGFSDLQAVFRQRLLERAGAWRGSYDERLAAIRSDRSGERGDKAVLDGFLASARTSIDRLAESLDLVDFGKAAETLAAAGTIWLVARRRSYPVAAFLAYALAKLGLRVEQYGSVSGIDDEILAHAGPKDAAICITFPPYAPQTIAAARTLSEQGVPVVALTDGPLSPVAQHAAVILTVTESDYQGFRSLSATFALAMALSVAIGERRQDAAAAKKV